MKRRSSACPRRTLRRYLFRELISPSILAVAIFVLVVLLTDMASYADLIVNGKVGVGTVAGIAALQLVPALTTTLPFAAFVGTLVALGRLSADSELLAMESMGISPILLSLPCLAFAVLVACVASLLSTFVAPGAQRRVRDELIQLASERPGLSLKPGVATDLGPWRVQAGGVDPDTGDLSDVLVFVPSLSETIFAPSGSIESRSRSPHGLHLANGRILSNEPRRTTVIEFETLEAELPPIAMAGEVSVDERASWPWARVIEESGTSEHSDERREARIELHRRLAAGAAALPLGLLAVGISMLARRFSRSGGVFFGLVGVVGYYALVEFSRGMLRRADAPVAPTVWMPNLILAGTAWLLIQLGSQRATRTEGRRRRRVRRPGEPARLFMAPRPLDRYVGGRFLLVASMCLFGLVLAYAIVDLADNLKWFNKYDATAAEIGRFYAARLPVLAARVIPLSLLLGCSLTISLLASGGELLGMRACGIPEFRALAPICAICLLAVPVDFVVINEVVPRANARVTQVNRTQIKNEGASAIPAEESVWLRIGNRVHEVRRLDLLARQAGRITVYEMDDDGRPIRRLDSAGARYVGHNRWLLHDPYAATMAGGRFVRDRNPPRWIDLGDGIPASIDTAHLTRSDLRRVIRELDRNGSGGSQAYRAELQARLAAPFACLILPAVAFLYAIAGSRFPRPVHALLASIAIAIVHAILIGLAGSLGRSGACAPLVAGWSPTLFLGVIALAMSVRQFRIRDA